MLRAENRRHNSLRSNKCRLPTNAFSRELRGSHAREIMRLSLEADRRLVVAALEKEKNAVEGEG